jgi:hypothetical protein
MAAHKYIIDLTADYVRSSLDYDPETGVFLWRWRDDKPKYVNMWLAGTVAGSLNNTGYATIRINYRAYLAHRLAWLYVHGFWPVDEIDHINRVRTDNRIANLREAYHQENRCNAGLRKDNSTGVTGVYWDRQHQKYKAVINGYHLGRFDTIAEATKARAEAEVYFFKEFRNRNPSRFLQASACSATSSSPAPAGFG